ncbi:MAG TPA: PIG-L family deacetylase [Bryobacteraceae bacterium]|jgi:LmbE family N-acetylglucosaminyl deacetylase|nr:PIG-L family deacetylase [Bryobacteraceae bacterium]
MLRLTVLSPHRDDAAFSLFICLSKLSLRPVRLQVLNIFTKSGYAPRVSSGDPEEISAVRRHEDRDVLRRISGRICVFDEDLVDAPLRTGVAVHSVCDPRSASLLTDDLITQIGNALHRYRTDLVLAPLTLGDHMDHVAVYRAALQVFPASALGFYEDLPYAMWTPVEVLKSKISATAETLQVELYGCNFRAPEIARKKYGVIQRYRSQITALEAKAMSEWSRRYRGGERVWLPGRPSKWRILTEAI